MSNVEAGQLIAEGAEARLYRGHWLGRAALFKQRIAKSYRHPTLDRRLRRERTRAEARLLVMAGELGLSVPRLYQVKPTRELIIMEWVEGPTWKEQIAQNEAGALVTAEGVGGQVARAHEAGLSHGDLTSSNVLVDRQGLVLIDWGLGRQGATVEQRGLDLQVLWECLTASHPESAGQLLSEFQTGYLNEGGAEESLARRKAIQGRGRYQS